MGIGHKLLLVACGVGLGFGLAKLLDNIFVIEIGNIDDKEVSEEDDEDIFETDEKVTTAEA